MLFLHLYLLFTLQMKQKFHRISKFLENVRIFEEKSVFEKNSGLFYFFSTPYSQIGECKSVGVLSTRS